MSALLRLRKGHDWEALDRLHQKGLISEVKRNLCFFARRA